MIEEETQKRVEELVAKRVAEELERRKDEIEAEVLRRVEEAKKVIWTQREGERNRGIGGGEEGGGTQSGWKVVGFHLHFFTFLSTNSKPEPVVLCTHVRKTMYTCTLACTCKATAKLC